MQFVQNEQLEINTCQTCNGSGYSGYKTCKVCHGMSMGRVIGKEFLYFGEPLTEYHIKVKKSRKILNIFRLLGGVFFWLILWGVFFYRIETKQLWEKIFTIDFWLIQTEPIKVLFWVGCIALSYVWYRAIAQSKELPELKYSRDEEKIPELALDPIEFDWQEMRRKPHKLKIDIAQFFTVSAQEVLERAHETAQKYGNQDITALHIFYSLVETSEIGSIFLRLGIPVKGLQAQITKAFEHNQKDGEIKPYLSEDARQILFHAYEIARNFKDTYVRTSELVLATVRQSQPIQEVLYDLKVDNEKLSNVVEWVRVREKMYEQYHKFRKAAARMSKHGMDRAMTAVATPYLNQFSKDVTLMAKYGHLTACVARDKEIEEIFRVVEAGKQNVLLVGETGVGKMTIIEGIVQKMIAGDAPTRLIDKRFVQISTTSLLAGTTVAGAQERLIRLMNEVSRAGNIILFINNLHDLTGISDSKGEGLDISEALAEQLSGGRFLMFATTTSGGFNKHIANTEIGSIFTKVEVREMDTNQAIQVLESKAGSVEYKHNIFFSYDAIERCVVLSDKFFYDQNLPESAIALMTEVASFVRNSRGENHLVMANDVGVIVSEKTGIPATAITQDESEKLLRLEEELHKRMIGQEIAVQMVANALRRARAEIRSTKRPIATFLFLGPTGVGKTELAKTIAEIYFGAENRMIRIDMSEYQDKSSIYRLIGQPGMQGTGLLTEAVRQSPFSLILLDELEKGDPDVLNLFLQVFDDGRLTDSVGRVIDFTNTIIIATSNAGTAYVQDQLHQGVDLDVIREHLLRGELKQYYRPEFLNRFDGVVLFRALVREEIKKIASLMLKRVAKDLETRGVGLKVEDEALESLAEVGFDPEFGARPMRRAIQDRVENQLAELIIQNKLERRDVVVLGDACLIRIERT